MKTENQGLRYPSIDELLKKINSKYKLAFASAAVAKDIQKYDIQVKNSKCTKAVGKALEEILNGEVLIQF